MSRIREIRKERRETQVELARKSGVTANTIARIERGEQLPSLGTLAKLARHFGVTIDELAQ